MKNTRSLLLLLASFLMVLPLRAQTKLSTRTQNLLTTLDRVVEEKMTYREKRETGISQEKQKAERQQGAARQNTYYRIFKAYARFQTDSAMIYLNKMVQTPPYTPYIAQLHTIGRAEIYAVTGSYAEARSILKKINSNDLDHKLRLEYYHLCRTLYGWMADFAVLSDTRKDMQSITDTYRDSILQEELPGISHDIVRADRANVQSNPALALQILVNDTAQAHKTERTFIYYNMAVAYGALGNKDLQMQYMALTAIADLKSGTTEYEALPRLAQLCYEANNPERAYRYLVCSMEDAAFCKARLRSIEASGIFPIIDRAYKEQEAQRQEVSRALIFGLCGVALILIIFIVSLRRQMKRLSVTRKQLAIANEKLEGVNRNLVATDKVKEEYIARYLGRCRNYIDTLEEFRRSLLKRFKAHQMEELYKELKSEETLQREQEHFFEEFDNSFLNLYPHFVEDFNQLLLPEHRIYPKGGELLTTELRIFALIRLGVTDSQRIAHFLNYSVATIYCYRSKVRNKAIGDKNTFEQQVMQL